MNKLQKTQWVYKMINKYYTVSGKNFGIFIFIIRVPSIDDVAHLGEWGDLPKGDVTP